MPFVLRGTLACALLFALAACGRGAESGPTYAAGAAQSGSGAEANLDVKWPDLEDASWERVPNRENDRALIVAVEDYAYLRDIPGATSNARAWQNFFTKALGMRGEQIEVLQDSDVQPYAIDGALRSGVANLKAGGRFWFVFIGHGSRSARNGGLLITAGSTKTLESQENNSFKQRTLLTILSGVNRVGGEALVVLDSCFSGKLPGGEDLLQGVQPGETPADAVPSNVTVMTAAKGDEYAGQLPLSDRPAFTYLLLGAMQGWGEKKQRRPIKATEARKYVNRKLETALQRERRQTPDLSSASPELVLALGGGEQEPEIKSVIREAAREPAPQTTAPSWQVGARSAVDVPPPSHTPSKVLRSMGSWTFLAGATTGIIGAALWGSAKSGEDELKMMCPSRVACAPELQDKYDDARSSAKWGNFLTPIGGGLAVLGAALWGIGVSIKPDVPDAEVVLTQVPGGALLQLRGAL